MAQGLIAEDTERMLISAVACGDAAAVDELYRLHSEQVMRFIFRRVQEHLEDAEEITLDTFVSAINLAGGYDGRSSAFTWLCSIAKLRIIDFYRKRDRIKRIPEEVTEELDSLRAGTASFGQALEHVEARFVVDTMLHGLGEDEREAILLRYAEQLSVREIAALLKRSEKGVEGLLTRAKSKAKAAMADWLPGGFHD